MWVVGVVGAVCEDVFLVCRLRLYDLLRNWRKSNNF